MYDYLPVERDVAHNFNINRIPWSQFGWIYMYAGFSKSMETVVIAFLLVGHYLPFDCCVFIDFRNYESLPTRCDGMKLGSYWSCRSGNVKRFCCLFVCLFVCLWFIVPFKNFSLIWIRHYYRCRVANFELCLALISKAHLLWHRASSERTRDTRTYCRAFSSGAVTTCFTS